MPSQTIVRSCRQEPRDYYFTFTIPNALQTVANLAQRIDQDAAFDLREVVPILSDGYRYQFFDPAKMPLQDNTIDPFDQQLDPTVPYPAAGQILLTVEDISGAGDTEVALLFRGTNTYRDYREAPKKPGRCYDVPKTYPLELIFTEGGQMFSDQMVYLDDDCDFALRQVIVSDPDGAAGLTYQFADRDRSFIQSGLIPPFGGAGIYDPEIVYPTNGKIVVNAACAAPGTVLFKFVGVNRYRVD